MPNIGPLELIVVLVIVLVIFGPKRLPGLGRQLGGGIKDFKEAVGSRHDDDEDDGDSSVAGLPAPPRAETEPVAVAEPSVVAEPVGEPVARPVAAERPREDA